MALLVFIEHAVLLYDSETERILLIKPAFEKSSYYVYSLV